MAFHDVLCVLLFLVPMAYAELKLLTVNVTMKIDHFPAAQSPETGTYTHRYMYDTTNYKPGGPVLFYIGGPQPLEDIVSKETFLAEAAANLTAAVVFAEHRYYGESTPNKALTDPTKTLYLSTANVLADITDIISDIKNNTIKDYGSLIVYGGQQGGSLAAWYRWKDVKEKTNITTGAFASSAPVLYFQGSGVALGEFDKAVTQIFVNAGCDKMAVYNAIVSISNLSPKDVSKYFDLKGLNGQGLASTAAYQIVHRAFRKMALNNFGKGADVVKNVCKVFSAVSAANDSTNIANLRKAIDPLYGNPKEYCIGTANDGCTLSKMTEWAGNIAEAYEECTDLAPYHCAAGNNLNNDFLFTDIATCTTDDEWQDDLEKRCGLFPSTLLSNDNKAPTLEAGAVSTSFTFDFSSTPNLIFTYGDGNDPNAAGVYSKNNNANGLYVYAIKNAGTSQDLTEPNTCDSAALNNARFQIVNIIKCWSSNSTTSNCDPSKLYRNLPNDPISNTNSSNCAKDTYPYGQSTGTAGNNTSTGDHRGGGVSRSSLSLISIIASSLFAFIAFAFY